MERFFIIPKENRVFEERKDYKDMSKKVNDAYAEFAKEVGIDSKEYYPTVYELQIVPTQKDLERFKDHFRKNERGAFKKTSEFSKRWLSICKEQGLKTVRKPPIGFMFNVCGGSRRTGTRLFEQGGVLYGSIEADCDFEMVEGFQEIKGSDFYKVIEELE